jgi:hypothetical protein
VGPPLLHLTRCRSDPMGRLATLPCLCLIRARFLENKRFSWEKEKENEREKLFVVGEGSAKSIHIFRNLGLSRKLHPQVCNLGESPRFHRHKKNFLPFHPKAPPDSLTSPRYICNQNQEVL